MYNERIYQMAIAQQRCSLLWRMRQSAESTNMLLVALICNLICKCSSQFLATSLAWVLFVQRKGERGSVRGKLLALAWEPGGLRWSFGVGPEILQEASTRRWVGFFHSGSWIRIWRTENRICSFLFSVLIPRTDPPQFQPVCAAVSMQNDKCAGGG